MASITLTFPDNQQTRIVNGICSDFDYKATLVNEAGESNPNPETKAQFAKRMIVERVRGMVKAGEQKEAEKALQVDQTAPSIT